MAAEAGRPAAFAAALAARPALARPARAVRLQRRQAGPRLGAAGRSGPLPRGRFRDRSVMRAAGPLLLHVFPSFGTGGPQVRFATLANRLGGRYRHAVVAMDGQQEARAFSTPRSTSSRMSARPGATPAAISASFATRCSTSRPDLLVTSTWGSIEWALADRHGRADLHMEDGFGPEERSVKSRTASGAPPAAAPLHRAFAVPPIVAYRHRDLAPAADSPAIAAERRRCRPLRRCRTA